MRGFLHLSVLLGIYAVASVGERLPAQRSIRKFVTLEADSKISLDIPLVKTSKGSSGFRIPEISTRWENAKLNKVDICMHTSNSTFCLLKTHNGPFIPPPALLKDAQKNGELSLSLHAPQEVTGFVVISHNPFVRPEMETLMRTFADQHDKQQRLPATVTATTDCRGCKRRSRSMLPVIADTKYTPLKPGASWSDSTSSSNMPKFQLQYHLDDGVVTVRSTVYLGDGIVLYFIFCNHKNNDCSSAQYVPSSTNKDISSTGSEPSFVFDEDNLFLKNGCGVMSASDVCSVNIAVGPTDPNALFSAFTIFAEGTGPSANALLMTLEQPYYDEIIVHPGQTVPTELYYKVDIPKGDVARIALTPITGDPDLYVSWDPANRVPGPNNNNAHSTSLSVEVIDIPESACPTGPTCTYYIGVRGFANQNSSYTIMASIKGTDYVELAEGLPQVGEVDTHRYSYYTFSVGGVNEGTRSFTISVTPIAGDPDLYVRFDGLRPNNTFYAAAATHAGSTVESLRFTSQDTRLSQACQDPKKMCNVTIAVRGWSAANFTILGTVDGGAQENTVLQLGVPIQGEATMSQGSYFVFTPTAPERSVVQFFLTRLEGDPDIFATSGLGANKHPSYEHSTWSSLGLENETIAIFPSDERYSWGDQIYIGVQAFYSTCRFTIVATVGEANTSTTLIDGIDQYASVHTGALQYFTFRTPSSVSKANPVSLMFSVEQFSGNVGMFVAQAAPHAQPRYPQVHCVLPFFGSCLQWGVSSDQYTVQGVQTGSSLVVAGFSDKNVSADQYYTVAVMGTGSGGTENGFIITLDVYEPGKNKSIQLSFFEEVASRVRANEYTYFHTVLSQANQDIVYTITSDVFMNGYFGSNESMVFPNSSVYDVMGFSGFEGIATVFVEYNKLSKECKNQLAIGEDCGLHLGVTSSYSTDFTITVTYSNSSKNPMPLPEAGSYIGSIPPNHYDYFMGVVGVAHGETIYVNLLSYLGDADVFVTLGEHPDGFGKYHYNYSSIEVGAGEDSIAIYADDPIRKKECPCVLIPCSCSVRVSIYNYKSAEYTIYALNVETNSTIQALPNDGRVIPGSVDPLKSEVYRVDMTRFRTTPGISLEIDLTMLQGQSQILINVDDNGAPPTIPDPAKPDSYSWASAPDSVETVLRIDSNDPNRCHSRSIGSGTCAYLVAVRSTASFAGRYEISAVAKSTGPSPGPTPVNPVVALIDGDDHVGTVDIGETSYFYFQWTSVEGVTPQPIVFFWNVQSGGMLDVFFSNDYNPLEPDTSKLPSPTHNCFNSNQLPGGITRVEFSPDEKNGCYLKPNTYYTVGFRGVEDTTDDAMPASEVEFRVVAFSLDHAVDLSPGIPGPIVTINNNDIFYFVLDYTGASKDVVIELTVLQGHAFLYVNNVTGVQPSCSNSGQTCSNFIWSNVEQPSMPIYVNASNPCAAPPAERNSKVCQGAMSGPSKWVIGAHAFSSAATTTLTVTYYIGGQQVSLDDGVPFFGETFPQRVCPERNEQGVCIGDPSLIRTMQAQYFEFLPAPGQTPLDMVQVQLRKNCSTDSECLNAPDFVVAVTACSPTLCTPSDRRPVASHHGGSPTVEFFVKNDAGMIFVPTSYLICSIDGSYTRCAYYIGVYPSDSFLGSGPEPFRLTVDTEATIGYLGRVDKDRTMPPVPVVNFNPHVLHVFEVFTGPTAIPVTVNAVGCSSTPIVYACFGSKCSPISRPGPKNNGAISKYNPNTGVSSISSLSLSGSMYLAVDTHSNNINVGGFEQELERQLKSKTATVRRLRLGTDTNSVGVTLKSEGRHSELKTAEQTCIDAYGESVAVLQIYGGDPEQLMGAQTKVSVSSAMDEDDATISVSFNAATISSKGSSRPASNAHYRVIAASTELVQEAAKQYKLNTACGVELAWRNMLMDTGISTETSTTTATLEDATPGEEYTVLVTVVCDTVCMQGEPVQTIVYAPARVQVPSSPANGNHHGKSKAGPIVGGIFGALIGVGLIVAAGWWFWRKRSASRDVTGGEFHTSLNYAPMED